jgi:hypothetical protein
LKEIFFGLSLYNVFEERTDLLQVNLQSHISASRIHTDSPGGERSCGTRPLIQSIKSLQQSSFNLTKRRSIMQSKVGQSSWKSFTRVLFEYKTICNNSIHSEYLFRKPIKNIKLHYAVKTMSRAKLGRNKIDPMFILIVGHHENNWTHILKGRGACCRVFFFSC